MVKYDNKVAPSDDDRGARRASMANKPSGERSRSMATKPSYSSEKGRARRGSLPSNKVAADGPQTVPAAQSDFDYTMYMWRRFKANVFAVLPPRMQKWLLAAQAQFGLAQLGVVQGAKTYFCFAVLFTIIVFANRPGESEFYLTHNLERLLLEHEISFKESPFPKTFSDLREVRGISLY
jgi:hypothetical protein